MIIALAIAPIGIIVFQCNVARSPNYDRILTIWWTIMKIGPFDPETLVSKTSFFLI